ncbi:MAG: hypothetical protein QOE58_2527, partial [Actinomycetota bacterium]|nr:hypothetical protein [Actinomycetota bacterium]
GIVISLLIRENAQGAVDAPVDLVVMDEANHDFPKNGSALQMGFWPRSIRSGDSTVRTHLLRRFALLGRTLESTQVWDVRRAIQEAHRTAQREHRPLRIVAKGQMAGVALYASLFEPGVSELRLSDLPPSHVYGPHFLNVLRVLDTPQAVAMAAERSHVILENANAADWSFAADTAKALGWGDHLEIHSTR